MEKNIIVAISDNNAIGRNNELLWHISDDLRFFKRKIQFILKKKNQDQLNPYEAGGNWNPRTAGGAVPLITEAMVGVVKAWNPK